MQKNPALLLLFIFALPSCRYSGYKGIVGNGNVTTQQRDISAFEGVKSYGSFNVYVSSGSKSVRVEAEENLQPYIDLSMDGDILKVSTRSGYSINPHREVKIFVTAPSLSTVKSYGSGNITGENKISSSSKMELGVNGSGDIKMDVETPELNTDISGSGSAKLSGETKQFTIHVNGSGDVKAKELKTENTEVTISGSGNAEISASVRLDVRINGSGDVRYSGNPGISSRIAGSGSVSKID